MPKKTRKQKLKSRSHRKSAETQPDPVDTHPEHSSLPTFSFTRTSTPLVHKTTQSDIDAFTYLRADLLKTVILGAACCGVVIALSFMLK